MQHENGDPTRLHRLSFRDPSGPLSDIVVSPDGHYRSKPSQFFQDFGIADISSVKNQTYASEDIQDLGTQQAVSIGNNTDDLLFITRSQVIFNRLSRSIRSAHLRQPRSEFSSGSPADR